MGFPGVPFQYFPITYRTAQLSRRHLFCKDFCVDSGLFLFHTSYAKRGLQNRPAPALPQPDCTLSPPLTPLVGKCGPKSCENGRPTGEPVDSDPEEGVPTNPILKGPTPCRTLVVLQQPGTDGLTPSDLGRPAWNVDRFHQFCLFPSGLSNTDIH